MIFEGSFYSTALDMETPLCVFASDFAPRRGPRAVCYVLHGLQGRCDDFLRYTMLPDLARTRDCLFVLPDFQRSFYADMVCGNWYFTYLTDELPRFIARNFRASSARKDTFLLGASMGGYGALKAALTYPDMYGACAALSPCCLDMRSYMTAEWRDGSKGDAFRRIFGDRLATDFDAAFGPIPSWRPENDVISLAEKAKDAVERPRICTCWGDGDIFAESNRSFRDTMASIGYPIESRELMGFMHNWVFFNEGLFTALPFLFGDEV